MKEEEKFEDPSEGSRLYSSEAEKKSFSLNPKYAVIAMPLLCFSSATNR